MGGRWQRWKRFFLAWVILALGLNVCSVASGGDARSANYRTADVVVIGAGLSGLMSALVLAGQGMDVVLLEKSDRVGGKLLASSLGGTAANVGVQYVFYEIHPLVDNYLDRLPLIPLTGTVGAVWDSSLYTAGSQDDLLLGLPIPPEAKLDLMRADLRMTATRAVILSSREFFFDKEPFSLVWWDTERQSAQEYLSCYHEDVSRIYNIFVSTEAGGEEGSLRFLPSA